MSFNPQNKMIIFTAPSGAGKTTLVQHVLSKHTFLDFSISATTREKRAHEVNGKHYHFFSIEEFKEKIKQEEFAEWEEVYSNQYYGTLKSEINRIWDSDKAIIFDVDVQGAQDLKAIYGASCMTIFIKPPSIEVLTERLRLRNTETEESFIKRINKIKVELSFETAFDAVIVNDNLEIAKEEADILLKKFVGILA
jgi:guanylate kinase